MNHLMIFADPQFKVSPRPYQELMRKNVAEAFKENNRVLAILPTGTGKTVSCGQTIYDFIVEGKNVLVLAHTRHLIEQFGSAMENCFNIYPQYEMGGAGAQDFQGLICGTIQSVSRRLDKGRYNPNQFDLIVIDEAHRSLGAGYQKVSEHFNAKVLGLTATPRRGDKKDLMDFFEFIAVDVPLNEMIEQGYLAPLVIQNIPIQVNLDGVRTKSTGDYDENELDEVITPHLESFAYWIKENEPDRRVISFLPLIKTSKVFASICNDIGLRAVHLDGTTDKDYVNEVKQQIANKEIDLVSNSLLLTEGIDIPSLDAVAMLRPTQSWPLYVQSIGRVTRISPETGKKDALILDPMFLCEEHSLLQRPANIIAKDDEEAAYLNKRQQQSGGGSKTDLLGACDEFRKQKENELKARLDMFRSRSKRTVDAMEFFTLIGDVDLAEYEPMAKWEKEDATTKQMEILANAGITVNSVMNKGHASAIINKLFERRNEGRATLKQIKLCLKLGYDGDDPSKLTFQDASDYISKNKTW